MVLVPNKGVRGVVCSSRLHMEAEKSVDIISSYHDLTASLGSFMYEHLPAVQRCACFYARSREYGVVCHFGGGGGGARLGGVVMTFACFHAKALLPRYFCSLSYSLVAHAGGFFKALLRLFWARQFIVKCFTA